MVSKEGEGSILGREVWSRSQAVLAGARMHWGQAACCPGHRGGNPTDDEVRAAVPQLTVGVPRVKWRVKKPPGISRF